jgi:hypothetical protein
VGKAVDIIQERHPAEQSVGLHFGSERIHGNESAARLEMRYDRCKAFDLYADGDTDGIWVAGNGSKIDDIGSCLEQVVCLRDGSMLVQEASSPCQPPPIWAI